MLIRRYVNHLVEDEIVKRLNIDCDSYEIPGIVYIPNMDFDVVDPASPTGFIFVEPIIIINKDDYQIMFPPKVSIEFLDI